jgi:hypothetical protein
MERHDCTVEVGGLLLALDRENGRAKTHLHFEAEDSRFEELNLLTDFETVAE